MGRINKPLNSDLFNDAKTWDLPSVDEALSEEDNKTNALNKPKTWKYEAPEEEVEEIKPLTAEEIDEIRQSAYEEGFKLGQREGHDKGYEEGLESGRNQGVEEGSKQGMESAQAQIDEHIQALTEQWQSLINAYSAPLSEINKEVEKELMILAVKMAESIIGVETSLNHEILLSAISEGIKVLPIQDKNYQFQMHPDDVALVGEHFGLDTLNENNWQLIENPSMSRGGCEIITENNAVDVSIERRSKEVFAKFLNEQGISNDPRTA
jgi:flagellar assembly protein FliH